MWPYTGKYAVLHFTGKLAMKWKAIRLYRNIACTVVWLQKLMHADNLSNGKRK